MAETHEELETPYTCEELMEKYILLENELESELENELEEEQEDAASLKKREDLELRFAKYERNYRSRRIRELTLTPFNKKRGRKPKSRRLSV